MNLRVIILKKTALLHKDVYTSDLGLGCEMLGPWVTMGHFDCMYSHLLDTHGRNIFAVIHENNRLVSKRNDGDCYFYPLYLLTSESDEAFWSQDSWFMTVTRIHLASTVINSQEIHALIDDIANQCKQTGCRCHIYQTIELSDLILVVKSNRISPMLDTVLNLWTRQEVGKIYTYCGVDYSYLAKSDAQPDDQNDIGFLSMRFAVRDVAKAVPFFEFIEYMLGGEPVYSIAGVDDVIVNFQNLKVQRLISFFRRWLVYGLPKNINIAKAFSDITTRLGSPFQNWEPLFVEVSSSTSVQVMGTALQKQCQELVDLNTCVGKLAENKKVSQVDQYWLRSLSELSYSLLRMSRNVLLDEFVYLMLPGIRAFLYNLKDILSGNDPDCLSVLDQESSCRFVDRCAQLMEHVMRTEGQLAHHPETRPIMYDIPLVMLEYILAFLELCSTILQSKDHPKKQIQFTLLPGLCSEIKTEEIFIANSRLPGLLAISIPLHLMYEPHSIQIALCHEISHYVGENHRNREQRRECYISAVSILIADLIFRTENRNFVKQIRKRLEVYVSSFSDADSWTISDYEQAVQTWIDDFLYRADLLTAYGDLIRDALNSEAFDYSGVPLSLHADFDVLRMRNINYFARILPVLTMLFREVFADICMVRLLNLDANTYMENFYHDISGNPESAEFYAVRIFTTLTAVGKTVPGKPWSADCGTEDQFYTALKRLVLRGDQGQTPSTYQFPISCVEQLVDYSNGCAEKISELLNSDAVGKMRRMYQNALSPEMSYQELQQFIQEYRQSYLDTRLPQQ